MDSLTVEALVNACLSACEVYAETKERGRSLPFAEAEARVHFRLRAAAALEEHERRAQLHAVARDGFREAAMKAMKDAWFAGKLGKDLAAVTAQAWPELWAKVQPRLY